MSVILSVILSVRLLCEGLHTPSVASPIHSPADFLSSASPPDVHGHNDSTGYHRLLPLLVERGTTIGSPQVRTRVVRSHQLAPAIPWKKERTGGCPSAAPILVSLPPSRASARSRGKGLPHGPASRGTASCILRVHTPASSPPSPSEPSPLRSEKVRNLHHRFW